MEKPGVLTYMVLADPVITGLENQCRVHSLNLELEFFFSRKNILITRFPGCESLFETIILTCK